MQALKGDWLWQAEDKKKSAVLDLGKHVDQRVRVKFTGGREGACEPKPLSFVRHPSLASASF